MIVDVPTPCFGKSHLFDSIHPFDHEKAKALCNGCDRITECRTELDEVRAMSHHQGGPEGTWAGELVGAKQPRRIPSRQEMDAQEAAYTDDDVRKAHAQYQNGARTEWALVGHRIYERQRARRRRDANPAA